MKKYLIVPALALLTGCSTTDSTWLKSVDGNQFEISSGTVRNSRFVTVENKMRTWNGAYQGGEEKIAERKDLLLQLTGEEAARICGQENYEIDSDPFYSMTDKSPGTFGGGLIGFAIAHIAAKNENIPTSIHCNYLCKTEPASLAQAAINPTNNER